MSDNPAEISDRNIHLSWLEEFEVELQEHWDGAGFFARIGLWMAGDMPENASWFG